MDSTRTTLIMLTLMLISAGAWCGIIHLDTERGEREIADQMRYLVTDDDMTPAEALDALKTRGIAVQDSYPRFGITDRTHWFMLRLQNGETAERWMVEASLPYTDYLSGFVMTPQGDVEHSWLLGDRVAFNFRPVKHPHLVMPVDMQPGASRYLLLRARSDNVLEMPVSIYSSQAFQEHEARQSLAAGFYYGIVAIMCLYNLMIFFSIRDSSYLYYVLYLGFFGITILNRSGLAFQWWWPEQPWWNHHAQPILVFITTGFSMLFADRFLSLTRINPRLSKLINTLAWALIILSPLSLISFDIAIQLTSYTIVAWTAAAIIVSGIRSAQGFQSARYFLLAFAAVGVSVSLVGLRAMGLVDSHWVLEQAVQVSTALEALLLSFALAHRMTALKQENEQIQQQANEELERRVAERTRELHNALNARSEFLATISHEVRTPLNGILGNIDLIRNSGLDGEQSRHLGIIEKSGEALLNLINDILDYSKIEAGKMELEREAIDVAALVRESASLFEARAQDNGVELHTEMADDFSTPVLGDALRLRQVLGNLISNAVKFTRHGRIDISVVREEENPEYVLFRVQDTGPGIDTSKAKHLFEHFYQMDSSTSRRHGGTGLGLAICRQLVELMGGEIGVDSQPGSGACFWFRIPLPDSNSSEATPTTEQVLPDVHRDAHILVVDDNHINLMVAKGLCGKLGYSVTTTESGAEALAVLLSGQSDFDLILMDCEMPDMDGFETTRRIRAMQEEGRIQKVPVIALTAHAIPEKIAACHEAGMLSHIAKPINLEKLGREIRHALKSSSPEVTDPQNAQADPDS
jgi:signal transduction histidine kinase/FixJ family two-component response regulator